MIRMQIQLTEAQARALKTQARREARSMSDLVRESVSDYVARHGTVDRADLMRGRALSGRPLSLGMRRSGGGTRSLPR